MNTPILESGMKGLEHFDLVFKRLSVDEYEYNLRRNGYTVANYVQKFSSIACLADAANRMYNALLLDYMISLSRIDQNKGIRLKGQPTIYKKVMHLKGQCYYRLSVTLHNTGVYYLYESCDKDTIHRYVLAVGLIPLMYVDHADINSAVTEYLEMALNPETAFSNEWRII